MNVAKLGLSILAVGFTPVVLAGSPAIYRCGSDGVAIYSDRPCDADAKLHESDGSRVTVYEAPPISSRSAAPPTGKAASNRKAAAARERQADQLRRADERRQANCAKLYQSLREMRTKMRTGYGVSEGERLKARQRQLSERRRREKCS